MAPFVALEMGLCQFQPGFPLLGNVQWLNWWHGVFARPCQNYWVTGQKRRAKKKKKRKLLFPPSSQSLQRVGHNTQECSQTCPLVQIHREPSFFFDSAETDSNPNQARLSRGRKNIGGAAGGSEAHLFFFFFCEQADESFKKRLKLSQRDSREKTDFKKRPLPGIINS